MRTSTVSTHSAHGFDARLAQLVRAAAARAGRTSEIGKDISRLSRLFGAERKTRSKDYLQTEAHRAAYLAFFTPRSAAQTGLLIQRAIREGHLDSARPPRVLDLGSGPLSGILGTWLAFGEIGASAAVDLSAKALKDGQDLLGDVCPDAAATTENSSVTAPFANGGTFDLIILSHVLNEIGDPRRGNEARFSVLRRALSKLAEGGRILVVEPATRVHGRALMRLRDAIVVEKLAHVLAPCPEWVANCPMLKSEADWCHADLAWAPPQEFDALTTAAALTPGPLKVSSLLLANEGTAGDGARLVGGIMRGRGQPEGRYACTSRGLVTLQSKDDRLPAEVRDAERGEWLGGAPPAGINVVVPGARRAQKSGSRRQGRGQGGGGGRRRS